MRRFERCRGPGDLLPLVAQRTVAEFLGLCRPDFVEFHLSYKDMDLEPADFLNGTYEIGLAVHAPELFAGSQLMDLTTPDDAVRAYSLQQTQRVIDLTRALKPYFPKTERPVIIANVGGFSMDQPMRSMIEGMFVRGSRTRCT